MTPITSHTYTIGEPTTTTSPTISHRVSNGTLAVRITAIALCALIAVASVLVFSITEHPLAAGAALFFGLGSFALLIDTFPETLSDRRQHSFHVLSPPPPARIIFNPPPPPPVVFHPPWPTCVPPYMRERIEETRVPVGGPMPFQPPVFLPPPMPSAPMRPVSPPPRATEHIPAPAPRPLYPSFDAMEEPAHSFIDENTRIPVGHGGTNGVFPTNGDERVPIKKKK